jgi:adenosylhomocysteine nucleosidase
MPLRSSARRAEETEGWSTVSAASPSQPLTGIVTALAEELEPLVARASDLAWERAAGSPVLMGRLAERRVAMIHTGVGGLRAEQGARALLAAFPVTRLVTAGVAGGLSPGLGVGEIVVGREVRRGGAAVGAPDEAWVARALGREPVPRRAVVVTVDRLVWNRRSKADLWRSLSADGAVVVDMESAAWARVAGERRIPYVVVRSVFDRAEDELPEFLERCWDPERGLSRGRVLRHALLRPRAIPRVLAMGARLRSCAASLPHLVEKLVAADPGTRAEG